MKEKLLQILDEIYKNTRSGITMVNLQNNYNFSHKELNEIVIDLYNEDKISIREGVNDYLITKKTKKR